MELLDTVFMVVRRRFRQVSPLHVYHHSSMLLLSECGYTKYSWPAFAMALMLNSLVHVVLYLYYGLTGIGIRPDWKVIIFENLLLLDLTPIIILSNQCNCWILNYISVDLFYSVILLSFKSFSSSLTSYMSPAELRGTISAFGVSVMLSLCFTFLPTFTWRHTVVRKIARL